MSKTNKNISIDDLDRRLHEIQVTIDIVKGELKDISDLHNRALSSIMKSLEIILDSSLDNSKKG